MLSEKNETPKTFLKYIDPNAAGFRAFAIYLSRSDKNTGFENNLGVMDWNRKAETPTFFHLQKRIVFVVMVSESGHV